MTLLCRKTGWRDRTYHNEGKLAFVGRVSQNHQINNQVAPNGRYQLVHRPEDVIAVFGYRRIVALQADEQSGVLLDDSGKDNGLSRHVVDLWVFRV